MSDSESACFLLAVDPLTETPHALRWTLEAQGRPAGRREANLLTVRQVAARIGASVRTLRRWVKSEETQHCVTMFDRDCGGMR